MTKQYKPATGGRGIEWTCRTVNALGGCKHACRWTMPDGTTAVCYAEELANNGLARAGYPHGFEHHYFRPNVLKVLADNKQPELRFMDSMSDMFGSWVPEEHLTAVFEAMAQAPQHAYQGLTKAPGRIRKYINHLPPNLWVGASSAPDIMMGKELTDQQKTAYTLKALSALREVKETAGNIVWMSLEPVSWDMAHLFVDHPLDWVVIGAATNGPQKFMPEESHIEKLLDVFDASGTAVFFKGNIRKLIDTRPDWRWREDFPIAYRDGSPIPAVYRRQENAKRHGWPLNQVMLEAESKPVRMTQSGQTAFAFGV